MAVLDLASLRSVVQIGVALGHDGLREGRSRDRSHGQDGDKHGSCPTPDLPKIKMFNAEHPLKRPLVHLCSQVLVIRPSL
jgi:hypothetical protein